MPTKLDYDALYLPFKKGPSGPSHYPVITNVQISVAGLVTWTTDIPSTSQVHYGTSPLLGPFTSFDSMLVTNHSVQLTGLHNNILYYLRVQSFYLDSLSISDLYSFKFVGSVSYIPIAANLITLTSFDANNTSLDELARVLGSLVVLFNTGVTITTTFTATNVTTHRTFDATNTSLDELANVLGSLIASLSPLGFSSDVYTVSNGTTISTYDATLTSVDELANGIGSLIGSAQSAGIIH